MITPEEFVEWWGEMDLFRFPQVLLNDLAIQDEHKRFLSEAGLPKLTYKAAGHIDFQLLYPAWSLEAFPQPEPLDEASLAEVFENSDLNVLLSIDKEGFHSAQLTDIENASLPNPLGYEAIGLLKFLESDEISQSSLLGRDNFDPAETIIDLPGRSEFYLLERVGSLRVLGACWFMKYICLDENASGSVIHYNGDNLNLMQSSRYFSIVNTSIPQFAESLLVWRIWWQEIHKEPLSRLRSIPSTIPDSEYRAYTARRKQLAVWLERELRRIDSEAFAHRKGFWRVVLKDLREDF